jgi:hypothetical protein
MTAPPRPPQAPATRSVARALDESDSLRGLLARVRESEALLALVRPTLPEGLALLVRAGPLDDQAWMLLAEHAAAAAKLRQCAGSIAAALEAAGRGGLEIKVKVRPRLPA